MKKLIALIFAALIGCSYAKSEFLEYAEKFMTLYLPDCRGTDRSVPLDLYFCATFPDEIESGLFIKTHDHFDENAKGLPCFRYYTIPPGGKLIFKLDNGEILSLECEFLMHEEDGPLVTSIGVFDKYNDYCYFRLNDDIIEKLLDHNIVKVRAQFKKDTLDCPLVISEIHALPETKDTLLDAFSAVQDEVSAAVEESKRQEALRENPLLDF